MMIKCSKKGCPGQLELAENVLTEKELADLLKVLRDTDSFKKLKHSVILVCDTCKVYFVKNRSLK
jgi:hypothetical protein